MIVDTDTHMHRHTCLFSLLLYCANCTIPNPHRKLVTVLLSKKNQQLVLWQKRQSQASITRKAPLRPVSSILLFKPQATISSPTNTIQLNGTTVISVYVFDKIRVPINKNLTITYYYKLYLLRSNYAKQHPRSIYGIQTGYYFLFVFYYKPRLLL